MIMCKDVDQGKRTDENREQLFRGITVHGERGCQNPFGLYEDEETKADPNAYYWCLHIGNFKLIATPEIQQWTRRYVC